MIQATSKVRIDGTDGQQFELDYELIPATGQLSPRPLLVFLHEGLGSISMWRDYPQRLCRAIGCEGLVYSRPGYGRSTPRPLDQPLRPDFMHVQAYSILPTLFEALGIDAQARKPWLFGHSDGGSIALLYAARYPDALSGALVLAPHLFVEAISVSSIETARLAYEQTDLKAKLAKHHEDVESAFRGWNDIWRSPQFRDWNIEPEVAQVRCPLLAVQGVNDEYGTMAQIERIVELAPQAELLKLANCGHSPHRDQPEALTQAVTAFLAKHGQR